EAEPIAAVREAAANPREAATRPQIPDVGQDSPRDMHGMARREHRPSLVRHLAQLLRLAFTAPMLSFPSPTPGGPLHLQLFRLAFRPAHPRPPPILLGERFYRGGLTSAGKTSWARHGAGHACSRRTPVP